MARKFLGIELLACLLVPLCAANAVAQTKLLRFPDLHGDRVAFSYAGDLWTAPASGGTASRRAASLSKL